MKRQLTVLCMIITSVLSPVFSINGIYFSTIYAQVDCTGNNIICKSGALSGDETWTSKNIYVITDDLTVGPSNTLTIEPGVIVKFAERVSHISKVDLLIEGELKINGTEDQNVYFTSLRDDVIGGDTNKDTGDTQPSVFDWGGLSFEKGSQGTVRHVEIRYGNSPNGHGSNNGGVIELNGSSPTLANITIRHSDVAAISMLPTDHPSITNFSAIDTTLSGLAIRGSGLTQDTTWNLTDIVYILTDNFRIGPDSTLTVEAGVTVKFVEKVHHSNKVDLLIEGELNINGTDNDKVYFTSLRDDAIGGDTNNDTGQTQPSTYDWGGLLFHEGSQGIIQHLELRYGNGPENDGVIHLDGSSPRLANVTVRHSDSSAISMLATDRPNIINFSPSNTSLAGLKIRSGGLNQDAIWDITGIVYLLENDFTIGPNTTLTIEPGVIVKFVRGIFSSTKVNLVIEGELNVKGTNNSRTYFTSSRDDAIGGDTNNDGGDTQPSPSDWGAIQYQDGSKGIIEYAVIRYGGLGNRAGAVHTGAVSDLTIRGSILTNNTIGLYAIGPTLSNSQRSNSTTSVPIRITRSSIYDNQEYGVFAASGASVSANENWWGRSGSNDQVAGNVMISSWCVDERCTTMVRSSTLYLPLIRQ